MNLNTQQTELLATANFKMAEAEALAAKEGASGEENQKFVSLLGEVKTLREKAAALGELGRAAADLRTLAGQTKQTAVPQGFKSLGDWLISVYNACKKGIYDPRLVPHQDKDEPPTKMENGWEDAKGLSPEQQKILVENTGATGGFLVPVEQRADLLKLPGPDIQVRPKATVIPIRRRQIQWPVLDQTNTTAGIPAWFGGVQARWTEESGYKYEYPPAFRQINLVAHKLVCLTIASDELLADSAISLEALIGQLFQGAISWYEEEAFINGTGAGQPWGIIGAGGTFVQARAVVGAIGLVDIINMLEHSYGNPVWFITRSALPSLLQLNGPAGNPSYVFIPNARDGMPGTLFGYPVYYNEHCPLIGNRGDIILADCRYYLIADRQATTIDASIHDRFRYDETVWRAVHRVDGQEWLSQPLRYSDGTTQVSPFVILDAATGS
jgi:HK97 family phage major capsid protein